MGKPEIYKDRIELLVSARQKEIVRKKAKKNDLTMNQVLRDMIDDEEWEPYDKKYVK